MVEMFWFYDIKSFNSLEDAVKVKEWWGVGTVAESLSLEVLENHADVGGGM